MASIDTQQQAAGASLPSLALSRRVGYYRYLLSWIHGRFCQSHSIMAPCPQTHPCSAESKSYEALYGPFISIGG